MDHTSDVAGLVDLGLTTYEAKAYLALIGRQDATPADVARIGPIPRQRAYDVLAALAERGLVTAVPGQGLRYRAQPPDEVVARLIAVRRRELDHLTDATAKIAAELLPRYRGGQTHGEPIDYVEVLRDREHAVERIEALWATARQEVLTFVGPPYLAPPAPEDATLPAGIPQRAIYETSLLDDLRMAELVRTYAALGEEIRIAETLPLKLTIVDRRSVAFNMPDPVHGQRSVTTLVVHHQALAATLTIAFDTVWGQATPLDEALDAHHR